MAMSVLWVDSRVGSKELRPRLLKVGIRTELASLESADFMFEGKGPNGPIVVGIERKTIPDLIDSLNSGRFHGMETEDGTGGQLGRLTSTYDAVWLLIEGSWATDRAGHLCYRAGLHGEKRMPGGMTEDRLNKQILTLELQGGIRVKQTPGIAQSVAWLASTFRSLTDKDWDAHQTLHTVHKRTTPFKLSKFREFAMLLPGVGLAASKAVEKYCHNVTLQSTIQNMLNMSVREWAAIEVVTPAGPRRLGESKATDIVSFLNK
jgi:ERCC4-type nuclease